MSLNIRDIREELGSSVEDGAPNTLDGHPWEHPTAATARSFGRAGERLHVLVSGVSFIVWPFR